MRTVTVVAESAIYTNAANERMHLTRGANVELPDGEAAELVAGGIVKYKEAPKPPTGTAATLAPAKPEKPKADDKSH